MMPSDNLRDQYLDTLGIRQWVRRERLEEGLPTMVTGSSNDDNGSSEMSWEELKSTVANCEACELHKTRTQTVFGVGNQEADWFVVGEAPGADEDKQGEPFVGRAGKLLMLMIEAIGESRESVYIANILKCRPPGNRDPQPEEVERCEGYLTEQISKVQPKIILAVGRIAAQNLLKTKKPIGELRGKVHVVGEKEVPVIVTYHPAYLLRSPGKKRESWKDLQLACQTLAGEN